MSIEAGRFKVRLYVKDDVATEQGSSSYGATVPQLPGGVAVAQNLEEVETLVRDAINISDLNLSFLEV